MPSPPGPEIGWSGGTNFPRGERSTATWGPADQARLLSASPTANPVGTRARHEHDRDNRPFAHRRFGAAGAGRRACAGGRAVDRRPRPGPGPAGAARPEAGPSSSTPRRGRASCRRPSSATATGSTSFAARSPRLRNRVATVQAQLEATKAELKRDKARLELLRARLKRALKVLRERLVAIYETSEPDAMTVILNSKGFDDLLNRYEYLRRVHDQDTSIAERVRDLRNQAEDTVARVRAARDEIAAKQAELEQHPGGARGAPGRPGRRPPAGPAGAGAGPGHQAAARGRRQRPPGPDPGPAPGRPGRPGRPDDPGGPRRPGRGRRAPRASSGR